MVMGKSRSPGRFGIRGNGGLKAHSLLSQLESEESRGSNSV